MYTVSMKSPNARTSIEDLRDAAKWLRRAETLIQGVRDDTKNDPVVRENRVGPRLQTVLDAIRDLPKALEGEAELLKELGYPEKEG